MSFLFVTILMSFVVRSMLHSVRGGQSREVCRGMEKNDNESGVVYIILANRMKFSYSPKHGWGAEEPTKLEGYWQCSHVNESINESTS